MALTPGTRLGVYEITTQIGEGGMGVTFLMNVFDELRKRLPLGR